MSEFKITGPGEYRTRCGWKVQIHGAMDGASDRFVYKGTLLPTDDRHYWSLYGEDGSAPCNLTEWPFDIIGPWVEPDHIADNRKMVEPVKTLRDEYAMAALAGILASGKANMGAAETAFAWADDMMAARQKGGA